MDQCTTIEPSRGAALSGHVRSAAAPAAAEAFTVLIWALAFPLIKLSLSAVAPLPLAAARYAIASTLILAWLVRSPL